MCWKKMQVMVEGWKVMTQNMGNGRFEERMEKLQTILEQEKPDVVMLQEPGEFLENINLRMRADIKREYVVFSKGLNEQERKDKWQRNGGKMEQRIRPSEGVMMLLKRERAVRVREHSLTTKRAILISIKANNGSITILANVYVESGDEEKRNEVWKEISKEITKIKKSTKECKIIVAGDWNACTEHDSVFVQAGKTRKVDVEMRQHLLDIGVEDKISEYPFTVHITRQWVIGV